MVQSGFVQGLNLLLPGVTYNVAVFSCPFPLFLNRWFFFCALHFFVRCAKYLYNCIVHNYNYNCIVHNYNYNRTLQHSLKECDSATWLWHTPSQPPFASSHVSASQVPAISDVYRSDQHLSKCQDFSNKSGCSQTCRMYPVWQKIIHTCC